MTTTPTTGPMPPRPGSMVKQPRQYGGFVGALIEMVKRKRAQQTGATPASIAANYALPGNLSTAPGPVPNTGLPTDAIGTDPAESRQMLMSNPDFASAFHERTAQQRNALNASLAARRSPYMRG